MRVTIAFKDKKETQTLGSLPENTVFTLLGEEYIKLKEASEERVLCWEIEKRRLVRLQKSICVPAITVPPLKVGDSLWNEDEGKAYIVIENYFQWYIILGITTGIKVQIDSKMYTSGQSHYIPLQLRYTEYDPWR